MQGARVLSSLIEQSAEPPGDFRYSGSIAVHTRVCDCASDSQCERSHRSRIAAFPTARRASVPNLGECLWPEGLQQRSAGLLR